MNYYSVYIKEKGTDVWQLFDNKLFKEDAEAMAAGLRRKFNYVVEVFSETRLPEPRVDY
jgi:hypothetical protein